MAEANASQSEVVEVLPCLKQKGRHVAAIIKKKINRAVLSLKVLGTAF
jgi:hypothetical protein